MRAHYRTHYAATGIALIIGRNTELANTENRLAIGSIYDWHTVKRLAIGQIRDTIGYSKGLDNVKDLRAKIWRVKKKYGIDFETYLQLIESQNEVCAICKQSKKLVIDHCHTTGKVRGLLCNSCNSGLGQFQDNRQYLLTAADYLK